MKFIDKKNNFLLCATAFASFQISCISNNTIPDEIPKIASGSNILFLLTDDQTFDSLGAMGNTSIKTPNMDKLASSGTLFRQAHVRGSICGAVCMPSRAMLLTGKDLYDIHQDGTVIPQEDITIPELFRISGYETIGVGKWHNGKQSYARAFDGGGPILFGGMSEHFELPVVDFDPSGKYKEKPTIRKGHSSEIFADSVISYILNKKNDKPFFIWAAFTAPHDPRTAPKEWHDMYPQNSIPLPPDYMAKPVVDTGELDIRDEQIAPFPRTPEIFQKHHADYYAMISHLDAQIGRIMDTLKASGQYENTIIVLTSDNGLSVGRHGLMGKQHPYEESIRVPLIITGPKIPVGRITDTQCLLQDIFPTLCSLTDTILPKSANYGTSLIPCFTQDNPQLHEAIFYSYSSLSRSVTKGNWKISEYRVKRKSVTHLFDLSKDQYELNNLADNPENAILLKEMQDLLSKEMIRSKDFCNPAKHDWGYPKKISWERSIKIYP